MPRPDVDVRAVAWTGLAIASTIVVVIVAVFVLLRVWRVAPGADRLRMPYALVVEGARLESAPQPELRAARAAKERLLTTSGWVDAARGIAHIPIATAMRVIVADGSASSVAAAASAKEGASAASAAAPASAPGPTSETGSTR
ncbi:MAG TPA: hypothetical protein VFF43_05520 [Caldimonas sp.]|nr:hypothetical protein [Caldimonas sp.]